MQMYGKPKKLISRIKFTIGLFCGGNISYKATEHVIESILKTPLFINTRRPFGQLLFKHPATEVMQ